MRVSLRSTLGRILFAVFLLALSAFYLKCVTLRFMASRLSDTPDRNALEAASRLEPSNAQHGHRLGRLLFYAFQDAPASIECYRKATALNPYNARTWLDLAVALQVVGDVDGQKLALERAIQAEPTTPDVAWEAANFFLIQEDIPSALRQFRVVLEHDPKATPLALDLCWRATHSAEVILNQVLPATVEAQFAFLSLLLEKQEDDAADVVWARLLHLGLPVPMQQTFPYLQRLLDTGRGDQAKKAWEDLAALSPNLRAYLPAENLVVNGGFEQEILSGGLDWRYEPQPHVSVSVDTAEFYSGSRSLSLEFDGQRAAEAGISQWIPIRPNTHYQFHAYVKSDNIESASGPRLSLQDASDGTVYALTRDFVGSETWRLEQAEFTTGPETRLLRLRLVRVPEQSLIKGRLWIDELSLSEK